MIKVRRVINKAYDNFIQSDYTNGKSDNLNPLRGMEFDNQIEKLTKTLNIKVSESVGKLTEASRSYIDYSNTENSFAYSDGDIYSSLNDLLENLSTGNINGTKIPGMTTPEWLEAKLNKAIAAGLSFPFIDLDSLNKPVVDCDNVELATKLAFEALKADDDSLTLLDKINGQSSDQEKEEKVYKIEYVYDKKGASVTFSNSPSECVLSSKVVIKKIDISGEGVSTNLKFCGWFKDKEYTNALPFSNLDDGYIFIPTEKSANLEGSTYKIYGKIIDTSVEEDNTVTPVYKNLEPEPEETEQFACILLELSFLKIILVILKIMKLITKIITTAVYIYTTVSKLVGLAAQIWINPAIIGTILAESLQTIISIIIGIVGMCLSALWNLISNYLDCVTSNTISLINQISNTLAGVSGIVGEVLTSSVSLISDAGQSTADTHKKIQEAKKRAEEMEKGQGWEEFKKAFGDSFVEWSDNMKNDILLNKEKASVFKGMLPSDLTNLYNTISSQINAIKTTISSIKSQAQQIDNVYKEVPAVLKTEFLS